MNKAGGAPPLAAGPPPTSTPGRAHSSPPCCLGILIFVDDYFNCLTVGSVMRPVTDRQRSRAKLATSSTPPQHLSASSRRCTSWAAAVTSSVPEGSGINGFTMFLRTIPYNYYAILTMVMSSSSSSAASTTAP